MQKERYALTIIHRNGSKKILNNNETMRDALANDIKDMRKIYKIMVYIVNKQEML